MTLDGLPAGGLILVGVDGSEAAVEAARYAADAAAVRGLGLLVVHACTPRSTKDVPDEAATAARVAAGHRLVEETLSQVHVAPATVVRTVVEVAGAAALLTSLADEAALLVLGRHHFDLLDGRLEGPVAWAVVARARCPVVVVPDGWSRSATGRSPVRRRPIVVGVDEQDAATAVLGFAYDEAELRQSPVLILHASTAAEPAAGPPAADARAAAEIVAGQISDHPDVGTDYLFVPGETVAALVDASSEASLLVLGRPRRQRGRRAWRHSPARAMLHQACCPLVVLPPSTRPAGALVGHRSGTRVLVA